MRLRTLVPVAALAALALLAAACTAGDTTVTVAQPQQTGISVSGNGSVTVVPDIALLNLGVEVTRKTVAEAQSAAAEAMEDIRDSLARNGIEERDIATQYFGIRPQYDYRREGMPRLTGFVVSNQLSIKVREMDHVSEVLDDAISAGGDAVRVNNVSFTVDEPERYLEEARQKAMEDARQRAEQLASLAGVTLGKARSISESGGAPPPVFARAAFDVAQGAALAPTPISPGETEVRLSVFVVYEVG